MPLNSLIDETLLIDIGWRLALPLILLRLYLALNLNTPFHEPLFLMVLYVIF